MRQNFCTLCVLSFVVLMLSSSVAHEVATDDASVPTYSFTESIDNPSNPQAKIDNFNEGEF